MKQEKLYLWWLLVTFLNKVTEIIKANAFIYLPRRLFEIFFSTWRIFFSIWVGLQLCCFAIAAHISKDLTIRKWNKINLSWGLPANSAVVCGAFISCKLLWMMDSNNNSGTWGIKMLTFTLPIWIQELFCHVCVLEFSLCKLVFIRFTQSLVLNLLNQKFLFHIAFPWGFN